MTTPNRSWCQAPHRRKTGTARAARPLTRTKNLVSQKGNIRKKRAKTQSRIRQNQRLPTMTSPNRAKCQAPDRRKRATARAARLMTRKAIQKMRPRSEIRLRMNGEKLPSNSKDSVLRGLLGCSGTSSRHTAKASKPAAWEQLRMASRPDVAPADVVAERY